MLLTSTVYINPWTWVSWGSIDIIVAQDWWCVAAAFVCFLGGVVHIDKVCIVNNKLFLQTEMHSCKHNDIIIYDLQENLTFIV